MGRGDELDLPAGDANLDGKVTAADTAIVEAHMGQTKAWWENGDFNHDGVVNAQDLALLEANLPATTAAATFVSQDTTTQGNWQGVYGSDGYNIIGDQSSYPVYATVTTTNASTYIWTTTRPMCKRSSKRRPAPPAVSPLAGTVARDSSPSTSTWQTA